MSAPSLAGEIAQLHELFKLGALTEEEFNTAKQATICNFMSKAKTLAPATAAPAAASASVADGPSASPRPETLPANTASETTMPSPSAPALRATSTRTQDEWQQLWCRSPLHLTTESLSGAAASRIDPVDVRVQALRCADRLLRNVEAHPTEAKYRRIRETNKVIARELLVVEASATLLDFAGFQRETENEKAIGDVLHMTSAENVEKGIPQYVWVQHDAPAEAARKAAAACRLVGHLLEYMGEQQSRRYGVQQLWRSVGLEVRLEKAASIVAASEADPLSFPTEVDDAHQMQDEEIEDGKDNGNAAPNTSGVSHPFLAYLVECYTVDEAGDGLYSSVQHLQTLQKMYEAVLTKSNESSPSSASTYSLLETADVYGAVVQQRGALELLLYGCNAQLHPCPTAVQRATTPANSTTTGTAEPGENEKPKTAAATPSQNLYLIQLLPSCTLNDPTAHAERCLKFLRLLQWDVEKVRQRRSQAARAAAEKSMRLELQRERQRQQLEQSRVRGEVEVESQSQRQRAKLHGTVRCASSSSSSSPVSSASSTITMDVSGAAGRKKAEVEGRRRIPIAEAVAILMGKKSPPVLRPPAASSS